MTTTGERLVAISTLSTGTALEHFLNISTGGAGAAYPVAVDDIVVVVEGVTQVVAETDTLNVVVEPGVDSDLGGGVTADLEGETDVDLECP